MMSANKVLSPSAVIVDVGCSAVALLKSGELSRPHKGPFVMNVVSQMKKPHKKSILRKVSTAFVRCIFLVGSFCHPF